MLAERAVNKAHRHDCEIIDLASYLLISTTVLFTAEKVLHVIVAAGTMAGLGTVATTTKEIWEVEAAISICVGVGWAGTRD